MNLSQALSHVAAVWGYLRPGSDWRKAPGARRAASSSGAVQARAQGGGDPLAVPVGDEPHGGADQVDHAGLDHGVGPGRLDGLGRAGRPVAAHDQHVLHAPVGQIGAHVAPFKEAPSPSWIQIPSTCLTPSMPRAHGDAGSGVPGTRWSARTLTRIASRRITG